MQGTNITYTISPDPETILIQIMSGSFVFKNSYLYNTSSPVFQFNGTSVEIEDMYGELITCRAYTRPFCLISARSSQFTSRNQVIRYINSLQDLLLFESCSSVSFESLVIKFANKGSEVLDDTYDSYMLMRKDDRQLFALRFKSIESVIMKSSVLSSLNLSALRARKTNITMNGIVILNTDKFGVTFLDTPEIIELGVDKMKFVVLESCNSSISDSDFQNSYNGGHSDGGVSLLHLVK